MKDTLNTTGLTAELREAIYWAITEDDWVPCTENLSKHKDEMIRHFGSPSPASYMSEEEGWQLDEEDAAAIRSM